MQQRAEDPAVGLSASLSVKEAELFITLMAGVTLPWSFSFSGLFFFPLFLFVFFWGGWGLVWFFWCVYLEGIQPLLSSFMHSLSSGSVEDRGGNHFSSSWKGGVASPLPPTAELPLLRQKGRREVENGLVCLVTSVPGS